jgi:hypothetical protein
LVLARWESGLVLDGEQRVAVASEDEEAQVSLAMARVGDVPAPWGERLWVTAVELVWRLVLELFRAIREVEEVSLAGSIEASPISGAESISIE